MKKLQRAVKLTQEYYKRDKIPWIVGFSGGKDSSLVIKILLHATAGVHEKYKKPITIFYCDTGVEIPIFNEYIKSSLRRVQREGRKLGLKVSARAVQPKLENQFFVKVIGRGYPPPTNKFRWCTDKLRIDPIQLAIKDSIGEQDSIVVLGTRYEESTERNRVLERHSTKDKYLFNQTNYPNTKLFCPIADFNGDDVWEGLSELDEIKCINMKELTNVYRMISGECPIIRMPDANPCSKGRFGCWTCTVIRKDKATKNLIDNGHSNLQPLYDFRQWLLSIRDDIDYRCTVRRNGREGLGPFRLNARKLILRKLKQAQKSSGYSLISEEEIKEIHKLWRQDSKSDKYHEDYSDYVIAKSF